MLKRTAPLTLVLAACAAQPTPAATDPVEPADSDAPPITPADQPLAEDSAAPEAACAPGGLAPGDHTLRLRHDGQSRGYLLHVPDTYDGTAPLPLLLAFHGWLETPEVLRQSSQLDRTADRHGFLVAWPEGLSRSWDGGACCGVAAETHADDVGFARAVVDHISARVCVAADRVYATGFSNGGFLTHRLACQAGDLFAAAAPVSAMMTIDTDTCDHATPLLHIHGTADIVVPYGGNPLFDYPSFDVSTDRWKGVHGCRGRPVKEQQERALCETWSDCDDGAELRRCTLTAWPHQWPDDQAPLDGNEEIWTFLSRFTLAAP